MESCAIPEADLMLKVLDAASSVDAGVVASAFSEPESIKTAVYEARLDAVKSVL
jgi:tRNA nucleotidyltransferase (CCA-adding enzyme)